MSKYIIKNCPCYNNERFLGVILDDKATFCTYYGKKCQDCTNCVMKQIVSHCKETINVMCADCGSNPYAAGRDIEARLILQKFDIAKQSESY